MHCSRALAVGLVLPPTPERDSCSAQRERGWRKLEREERSLLLVRAVIELRERKGKDKPTVFIFPPCIGSTDVYLCIYVYTYVSMYK